MIAFGSENPEIKCGAPFLIQSIEEDDNSIRFIISLPIEGKTGTDINDMGIPNLKNLLADSTPIYPDKNSVYEIVFRDYILHLIRNESFCCWDDYEIRQGRYLIIFEKSRLSDCMPQLVNRGIAEAYYPNGWKHYGICCQNHIIDIIAPNEPVIHKLSFRKSIL